MEVNLRWKETRHPGIVMEVKGFCKHRKIMKGQGFWGFFRFQIVLLKYSIPGVVFRLCVSPRVPLFGKMAD